MQAKENKTAVGRKKEGPVEREQRKRAVVGGAYMSALEHSKEPGMVAEAAVELE